MELRTLAVGSPKGGVGKTTSAGTLAAVAARLMGLRVLVLDMDSNHSALDWLSRAEIGVDVAAATPDEVRRVRRARGYDLVVIDLPGARDENFDAVLGDREHPVADFLLMPTRPEVMDLRPVVKVARRVVVPSGLPYLVAFLIVPVKAVPAAHARQVELRAASGGLQVADTVVRQYNVVDRAVEQNCTVLDLEGGRHSYAGHVKRDYCALGAEVFGRMGLDVTALREEPQWLG